MDENIELKGSVSNLVVGYSTRKMTASQQADIENLKVNALEKLRFLLEKHIDLKRLADVKNPVAYLKKLKSKDKNDLIVLYEDYIRLSKLEPMIIPDNGHYYKLDERAAGVTEKILLISDNSLRQKLGAINAADIKNIKSYIDARKEIQLKADAIIKLPKHKDIKEVQREAIALAISETLGFVTTKFTMLSYQGNPALFIPFEDIELLDKFAKGEPQRAYLGGWGKTYTHYSTIKPVGESLLPDQSIDDFGNTLAYFYLCSDPDFIGGYNQNKALKNNKSLYIFDQVLMNGDNFIIDSALNLTPSSTFYRHTRHGQGRNRSLINDSSFSSKFNSIKTLIEKKTEIGDILTQVISGHEARLKELKQTELKSLKEVLADAKKTKATIDRRFKTLLSDFPKVDGAKLTDETFSKQMDILEHALALEKVLNGPTLFTEGGRPYRNPMIYRPTNKIKNIEIKKDGKIAIFFNENIDVERLSVLRKALGMVPISYSSSLHSVLIEKEDLAKIEDTILLPESKKTFDANFDYLDMRQLELLKNSYKSGNRTAALNLIQEYKDRLSSCDLLLMSSEPTVDKLRGLARSKSAYILFNDQLYYFNQMAGTCALVENILPEKLASFKKEMKTRNLSVNKPRKLSHQELERITSITDHIQSPNVHSPKEQVEIMKGIAEQLKEKINTATNKGFLKHVLRKLEFDIQKRLQKIMQDYPDYHSGLELEEAFNMAIKLDRVSAFNSVVMSAIGTGFLLTDGFKKYVAKLSGATAIDNYDTAQKLANELSDYFSEYREKSAQPEAIEVSKDISVPDALKEEDKEKVPNVQEPEHRGYKP